MANAKPTPEVDAETAAQEWLDSQALATEGWEWENVSEESGIKVSFDKPGDMFIGQYEGRVTITPPNMTEDEKPFDLFNFRATDDRLYSVNTSYKLDQAMEKVEVGQWVRITYTKDVPTKKPEPMKDFRVDVRK